MGATRQKVNAKRFLQDYRAGKSEEELRETFGLSPRTYEKLLQKLVAEKLLDPSEVGSGRPYPKTEALEPPVFAQRSRPEPSRDRRLDQQVPRSGKVADSSTRCPQCNAEVSEAMLICPECGHVLPGEERWARVEPKKRVIDRIPPKVLGVLISIPVVVALFFVFKDIIIPMTDATIERQSETARKKGRPQSIDRPLPPPKQDRIQWSAAVDKLVKQLVEEEILTGANPERGVLNAGRRWWEITEEERIEHMEAIRQAMGETFSSYQFQVIDQEGWIVVRANEASLAISAQPHKR